MFSLRSPAPVRNYVMEIICVTWEDVPSILTNQMVQAMWWHSASRGDKAPVNNRSLQAGIQRAQPCESNMGNMFILSFCCPDKIWAAASSLFDGTVCFWERLQNSTNKTWRIITLHSSEPNTPNKVGNRGRNWVCSGSSISLDLTLCVALDKASGHVNNSLEVSSEWPLEHGGCNGEMAPSMNVLLILSVLFSLVIAPSERATLY